MQPEGRKADRIIIKKGVKKVMKNNKQKQGGWQVVKIAGRIARLWLNSREVIIRTKDGAYYVDGRQGDTLEKIAVGLTIKAHRITVEERWGIKAESKTTDVAYISIITIEKLTEGIRYPIARD